MRRLCAGIVLLYAGVCLASDSSPSAASSVCLNAACPDSKRDIKAARHAFAKGVKLEKAQSLDEAFSEFEEAARLVPQNVQYLTAREMTRQQLVLTHLQSGKSDLIDGRKVEAVAEFRTAVNLDPQNEFAQQRLLDAAGPVAAPTAIPPQVVSSADTITNKPINGIHIIHYSGDSRGLLTAVAASYGLTVVFDDNFPTRHVRFDLDDADFATAMQAASIATKSFSVALEDTILFAAVDNAENHRLYDRMGMRSFYVSGGTPQDMQDLMNALRTLFEFKFASLNAASSTITLRGPKAALDAATQFLGQLDNTQPEVMFDLKIFQVSHSYMRSMGIHIPSTFNLFNIPVSALEALGGQSIQTLINQLIASGGINQAGNSTIAALIAQLQSQESSLFSQPVATFGGGLTFFGLSLDQLSATFSMNSSSVRELDHVTLRASHTKEATFKMGSRYPILNASFSPIANSPAIASAIGNQSFQAPFPSVNYEDIGLTIKAKPQIHNNSDVGVELEVQFRTLGSTITNGIPDILNREYKGGILLKEGEPAVVAGMVTESDQRSLNGLPLFSKVAGLSVLTSQTMKQESGDELLMLITPYVIRSAERAESPEIWMGK
jgi:general secretion pathway protein D